MKGVKALLADGSFTLPSSHVTRACKAGEWVVKRIQENPSEAAEFERKLQTLLNTCLQSQSSSQRVKRERIWLLRTSDSYFIEWQAFQIRCGISEKSAIFSQYKGDYVFKEMIKLHFPLGSTQGAATGPGALTNEETNALWYAAGYCQEHWRKHSPSLHTLWKRTFNFVFLIC